MTAAATMIVRGVVEAGEVSQVALRVGAEAKASSRPAGELVLALDGGGRLTVDVGDDTEIVDGGDVQTERGAWGELRARPAAQGLPREVVQPFIEVELRRVTLAPGACIAVWGEITEHGFAADGGPRTAPTQVPRACAPACWPPAPRPSNSCSASSRRAARRRRPRPRPRRA